MKNKNSIKAMLLSLSVAAAGLVAGGVVASVPTTAAESMTVSEAISGFIMEEGAAVRKNAEKQGIRFNAILDEQAYNVLNAANAEFGMLIVPKDYVTEGYELTAENVFGENAVYQANVKASEVEEGKKAIIQITEPTITKVGNEYKIYGSLVGVLDANLARGFIGTAYVCVDGVYYLADYADGMSANNTRSMAYVAKCAVDGGDSDSAKLQTTYIDPVKDMTFTYTVNKVTVDFDGSVVKETITTATAQFATAVEQNATAMFGFKGKGVDSFVGMENAEFNVMYNATPVSVVLDADPSATETYAAEELASYISQVTGNAVEVLAQANSEYNNIYVSTDTSLALEADSFKLSYDENGNVYINGVDERGTLYGVYEYEESYMGIKFLTESYTHVPVTNQQIAGVSETKTYTPSFAYRTYMNNSIGLYDDANVKYSSHLRFISQFSNERAQSDLMNKVQYTMPWMAQGWLHASHSILAYAAIGAYQAGLTDILTYSVDENGLLTYCAFNDNATTSAYKSAFDTSGTMLDVCYSNATAKAWVKAGLQYAMENYPEMEYFMLGQADKRTNCGCSDCRKARLYGCNKSYLIANFVKEMATYVNDLGYSDKKIVMFAYQDTETAPKAGWNYASLTDMPANVYVQWAPVDSDEYSPLNTTNIEGWKSALGMTDGRFLVWSYEVDFASYFTYYPTMQNWVENFDTYKDLGVDLVMMQSSHNTSGIADSYLDAYVASKLLWNFKADSQEEMNALVNSAKSEFIEYFYGASAKSYVESYYAQFDALYESKFANGGYNQSSNWSFTESELNGLLALLDQAIAVADNETYVNHLNMLALTPRYMKVKYCQTTDSTLANDISSVATLTSENTSVANDANLQGLSFTRGNTTIYNVKYDADNRVVGMTVDMPQDTEWSWNAPRFTAEYLNELYASGVRYVVFNVNSTTQTNHFITYYGTTLDFDGSDGYKVALVENGGELKISYVDLNTGNTVGTTLNLSIAYYMEGQETASEIGLTVENNVTVNKSAENAYTISNTNGMNSVYFSADQVNAWIAAGYDAISMNVSFTADANMSKVVALNGSSFATMKALLTDETGNANWTLILAEDTPIHLWAQNGDNNSTGAFTLSNVTMLTHQLGKYAYDENNHWNVCTREGCNHVSDLGAHTYGYTESIGAIDYGCTTCGYVQSREVVTNPTVDFTSNMYGATVYSCVWAVADDTRITEKTADSLKYLVYHDNGEVNALSKLYLPRINFANFDKVTVNVLLDTFAWNQQYGLSEDALTNISDTWIDWASHEGTLTFEWVDGNLVMKLVMNGKTLTKTITDADIINGKASAYFCVQAYYDRYVTLSGFDFSNECAHVYGDWTMGSSVGMKKHVCLECGAEEEVACTDHAYSDWTSNLDTGMKQRTCAVCGYVEEIADADNVYGVQYAAVSTTVTNTQYDANNRLAGLTVVVPNNMEWSNNSPMLTAEYLNKLYAEGIRKIAFTVNSTATTNNFITYYGTTLDYDPRDGYVVDIINNGGALKFSYVDLNNNGNTVATTLTITLTYLMDPQELASEIGMTVANGVTMSKEAEGVYTIANTNGYQGGVAFSAEQVNAWIAEGYESISMNVSFTPGANIDTVVAYSASTSWVTDSTGNVVWTFALNSGEAIDFWVQKNGATSVGAFTLSNVTLNLAPQAIADEIGLTLANGVNINKNGTGVYTISNTNGYQGGAAFTAEQVNAWLAQGYVSISMNVSFTASANIDTVVAYSASTGFVTDSTGNVVWTFTLKSGEAIDFWVQKNGATSAGAFTMSNVQLKKQPPYGAGYTSVSNETYDASDRLVGMTMVVPDYTEWSNNSPYFTQAYLNTLYAAGVRSITFAVESSTAGYNFITVYNGAANYNAANATIDIVENGGDLKFSYVNLNNGGYTVGTTLTMALSYQLDPQVVAGEIGLTLATGVNIVKTADNAYTISNTNGYQGGVAFSAQQVNTWLSQGYTKITFSVSFTASADISKVIAYGPTAGWLIDETGNATWTVTLGTDAPIDFWVQSGDTPSTGAFTISNITLA